MSSRSLGKTLKDGLFLGKAILSMSVGLGDDRFDEAHVVFAAGEGATATQQQRLIDPLLKMPIGRLNVAIFIGTPRVGSFSLAAVVLHQRGVSRGVGFATGVIVDRSAERIAAVTLWHAAKFPKRFLNPRAQRLKRFRKTETDRFDVAVRQDAVKQGMVKTSAGDLDAEAVADGEIAGCQPTRMVELRKHDGLAGAEERLPFRNPTLERSPGRVGKFAGPSLLQPAKKRMGFDSRFVFKTLLDFRPNFGKRIGPSPIVALGFSLRRQPIVISIIASRFVTHFSHPCTEGERFAPQEQSPQFLDLSIAEHRKLR